MKKLLFTLLVLTTTLASAQQNGDYRTRISGNWNYGRTWEIYYNGIWNNMWTAGAGPYQSTPPSHTSGTITVRHNVTVTASTTANEVILKSGVTLTNGYALTFMDDPIHPALILEPNSKIINNMVLDFRQINTVPCQINGTIVNTLMIYNTNPAVLSFNSGSAFEHAHTTGNSIPLATWHPTSTCIVSGMTASNPVPPGNLNQVFGNFTWNTPSMGATTSFNLDGNLQNVRGNLTFISTGATAREVRLKNGGTGYTLNVGGDLNVQGGTVTLTQNQTSVTSISVAGDVNVTGGTVTLGAANNAPVNLFLKGQLQKTPSSVFNRGTGTGEVKMMRYQAN